MKYIFLLTFLIGNTLFAQPNHGTGANFNAATIAKTPQKIKLSTRSFRGLTPAYSLEQYCPTPGDQGNHGTCVAFANAYGIATILYAKTHNITDKNVIDKYAFSATYLYEQIKDASDNDCQNGSDPIEALIKMMTGGDAFLSQVPYQCGATITDDVKQVATNYKIKDAAILFAAPGMMQDDKYVLPKDEIIASTKKALLEGNPVSTGWHLPESFFYVKDAVWNTTADDQLSDWKHNGHAMAVVGYDDNKYGGAFRILNSWGTDWADGGFVWIKYDDYAKWCILAMEVFPDPLTPAPVENNVQPEPQPEPNPEPKPIPNPEPKPVPIENKFVLSGDVEFKLSTGEDMPVNITSTRNLQVDDDKPAVKEDLVAYTMQNSYTSGTRFKFYLNIDHEAYVYAFATDLSGKVNLILPYDDMISTHVGTNSSIAFPSDTKSVKLDDNKGTDYLLILYAAEKLDAKQIAADMNEMDGALSTKIKTVLGDKLMDKSIIKYSQDKVGFSVNGTATRNLSVADDSENTVYSGGTVVPLMVEIKHN
ncbi:MAG: DUF4384 domain-containing protein [Bacteroidetes bacterium]|nr:DUF4384 domain-containing protein [Bacteroidota bacterium]